jgi:hypothetical protein
MDASKFKSIAKRGFMTVAEVSVVGGSMLLTTKFLDFETLFKNQIAKDPTYKDKWFIKHQGAIKLVAGATAAAYVKNPWLKLLFIGVAANGFIQEVRVLTTKADGTNFFNQIGNTEMDQRLRAAATGTPLSQQTPTQVGEPLSQSWQQQVGKRIDLMDPWMTNVGQPMQRGMGAMERGTGCAMSM